MEKFNKMKRIMNFQIISIISVLIVTITLGIIFLILFDWGTIAFGSLAIFGVAYSIICLKVSTNLYSKLRVEVAEETFKEVNTYDTLEFNFMESQPIDIFTNLGLDKRTPMFFIDSTLKGMIDDVKVLSFSARYRPYNLKQNYTSRIYCFKFGKEIKKCHLKDFDSDHVRKGTVDRVLTFKEDEVYISLGGDSKEKNFYFQLQPIAYKTYDLYKERMKAEIDFIKYAVNHIKEISFTSDIEGA